MARVKLQTTGRLVASWLLPSWLPRLFVAVIASTVVGGGTASSGGEPLWERLPPPHAAKVGSLSCASATCHGNADELIPGEPIAGHEHPLWVEFDPHAKAVATVESERYRSVLAAYHQGLPRGTRLAVAADRCAVCHDPQGLATSSSSRPQGIGCEDCHGPAEKWLDSHYQRSATRDSLRAQGFLDLKNLVTRGRVCAGCHVGDADHALTHDMYAAGHPALRFELSSYHDLIARKHWPEQERLDSSAFKLRLWAAGQTAVTDAMLGQLESRAALAAAPRLRDARGAPANASTKKLDDQAGDQDTHADLRPGESAVWPEFAEYDCFACHQRLRAVNVGPDATHAHERPSPGSPAIHPRAVAARPGIRELLSRDATSSPNIERPAESNVARGLPAWQPFNQGLARLFPAAIVGPTRALMEARFDADPVAVRDEARAGRRALRESPTGPLGWQWSDFALPRRPATGGGLLRPEEGDVAKRAETLLDLLDSLPVTPVDWSDASQRWLAVNALVRAAGDERRRRSTTPATLTELERTAAALRFDSAGFDWPRYDGTGLPGEPFPGQPSPDTVPDLVAIGLQFRAITGQLGLEWPGRPAAAR
jgi:hypothetical protein